jgi:hypothetical protein
MRDLSWFHRGDVDSDIKAGGEDHDGSMCELSPERSSLDRLHFLSQVTRDDPSTS